MKTETCVSCGEMAEINPHAGCCNACADAAYDAACPCLPEILAHEARLAAGEARLLGHCDDAPCPEIHSAEWVDRMEEIDASMGPI
jgi:hypothetical protein